ncbi:MAG: DUF421 domain-containing protein [Flavobacterium sp.]|nr:MAG: DUF421 domain-containing protein [Flavobacterium sp.]
MYFIQADGFNWKDIFLGESEWEFIPEVLLRSAIMFLIVLVALRILGKRGVRQLSVFELVVIIGLGSAAGDPMFYKDVGILPSLVVFAMIIALYSLITWLIGRNKKFELLVEGKPVCLIKNGVFEIENFKKEALGEDEFFAELRLQGVSQLGQIEQAIEESNGGISIFYFEDDKVKYGLPIMPKSLDEAIKNIEEPGYYACIFCGCTKKIEKEHHIICPQCGKEEWVKASNKKRIR